MRHIVSLCLAGLFFAVPLAAKAELFVFACEPEWAALAEEIGGDQVKTFSATHAKQDPHYIRARPSLIAKIRKADLLICSGAGLEVGWLPILLQKAKSNLQPGSIGHLMAADVIETLEKPTAIDRSHGDVHPEGNPHLHLNPHNLTRVAKELKERLKKIDADNAATYQRAYDNFKLRWQQAITKWEAKASSLKGKEVVVHHKSFTYLLDWLGLKQVGSLEPKPGIPPTSAHLGELLQELRQKPAYLILRTAYDPDKGSLWLSEKANIPAIELPYTIGGDKYSDSLFSLFDRTITLLTKGAE